MLPYLEKNKQKITVKKIESLCELLNGALPHEDTSFTHLFKKMDTEVRASFPEVSTGALSNVHGDWYENLIAVVAWNMMVDGKCEYLLLPIPKASSFDLWSLYESKLYEYVKDLRSKVFDSTGTMLITSNPDFVILKKSAIPNLKAESISALTPKNLSMVNELYVQAGGMCGFDDLIGFLSVKTSMRPDRRLQVCHEGAMMKSVYSHIRTREWILNATGMKYFAATTKLTTADRNALRSVAGHSLAHVQGLPESSVDEAFCVDSVRQVEEMIEEILNEN